MTPRAAQKIRMIRSAWRSVTHVPAKPGMIVMPEAGIVFMCSVTYAKMLMSTRAAKAPSQNVMPLTTLHGMRVIVSDQARTPERWEHISRPWASRYLNKHAPNRRR